MHPMLESLLVTEAAEMVQDTAPLISGLNILCEPDDIVSGRSEHSVGGETWAVRHSGSNLAGTFTPLSLTDVTARLVLQKTLRRSIDQAFYIYLSTASCTQPSLPEKF
jgi:hypothetical protein